MTSKTQTESYLRAVELPQETKSYAVISHGIIIDTVREMLEEKKFKIINELYKAEAKGDIALGFMQLQNGNDPDMSMTFNWTNSYNKQVKFGCSIGGFIYDNQTPFVSGTSQGKWNRKHTGTALDETKSVIESMIESANDHFAEIIAMKEQFKSIKLSRKDYAKLSGLFFFDKMIISPDQASVLKKEYDNPSINYKDKGTLWEYYKMLMLAVADQAPKNWYKQQAEISNYINILYSISKSYLAPGEINLETTQEEDIQNNEESKPEVDPTRFLDEQEEIKLNENLENETDELDVQEEINYTNDVEIKNESFKFDLENEVVETFEKNETVLEDAPLSQSIFSEEEIQVVEEELGIKNEYITQDSPIVITEDEPEIESLFEILEEEELEEEEEETPWYNTEEEKQNDLKQQSLIQKPEITKEMADMLTVGYETKKQVVQVISKPKYDIAILDSDEFFAIKK